MKLSVVSSRIVSSVARIAGVVRFVGRGRLVGMARFAALSSLAVFSSAVMPQVPTEPKLPYGLSCSQCMLDEHATCAALPKAELIVDARRMEPIDERRDCGPGQTCHVSVGSRFGSVFVLRSPKSNASTTIFLTQFTEGDANQTGVRLMPDTRYVLFTKRTVWNAPFKAQWHVMAACAVPQALITTTASQ